MKKIALAFLCLLLFGNLLIAQGPTGRIKTNSSFFPIAVWSQNPTNAADYKSIGINMYVAVNINEDGLNLLRKSNIKAVGHLNKYGLEHLNDTIIYGWMHGDEPDNAQSKKNGQKGYDPCIDPSIIVKNYEDIKQKDPSRPVYINLGMGVSNIGWFGRGECTGKYEMYKVDNNGYLKGCDIASFDIYPVNTSDKVYKDKLWFVPKGIDSLLVWSHAKPSWCWIECTRIGDDCPRKPTTSEVKTEVWMALIHGANGFGYFCHSFPKPMDTAAPLHDPEMKEAIKAINAQVTALAPVLNSANIAGYATAVSNKTEVPVDIMTKNYNGTNYIFAVGMRPGETNVTFNVKKGSKAEVLGENRRIKIKKGKFSDAFASYGVHLYQIK